MSEKRAKAPNKAEKAESLATFTEIVDGVLDRWRQLELLRDDHAGHVLIVRGIARELEKDPGQPTLWRELRVTFTDIMKTQGSNNDEISALFKDLDATLRNAP
jgi:hypothetical protein